MNGALAELTTALMAPSWTPLLVDLSLKGAVVLLMAAGLSRAVNGASAALRHQLWTVALVSLLALPVLSLSLPAWQLPLLPAAHVGSLAGPVAVDPGVEAGLRDADSVAADVGASAAPAGGLAAPPVTEARENGSAGTAEGAAGAAFAGMPGGSSSDTAVPGGSNRAPIPVASRGAGGAGGATWSLANITALAVAVWLLGVSALLARLVVGAVSAAWLTAGARPVEDPAWRELAVRLARRLELARPVALRRSPRVRTPMAWGLWRSAVLLPVESEDWSAARRRVVLLHEIAHLKRRDCLTQLVADAATALHWFNPLAWWGARRLRAEREQACDDLVLAAGTPRADYARHLLEIARGLHRLGTAGWAAVSMARPSQLEGRLLAILDPDRDRRALTRAASLGLTAVVVLLLVPLATLQPWAVAEPTSSATGPEQELRATFLHALEEAIDSDVLQRALDSGALAELIDTGALDAALRSGTIDEAVRAAQHELEHRLSHPAGLEGAVAGSLTGLDAGVGPMVESVTRRVTGLLDDPALLGQMAAGALAAAQRSGDEQADEASRQALQNRVLDAMVEALQDPDADMRREAAHTLGRMENPVAVDALGQTLTGDEDPTVRQQAAWALGMIEDPAAVPHLEAAIDDPEESVREQVVWALGMIEDPSALPALSRLLDDGSPGIRQQAAWALGMIEDAAAVDALASALADPDAEVRQQAAWALGMIEDGAAVSVLGTAMSDDEAEVRQQAAWALGMIEDPAGADALATAVQDPDPEVRAQVVWALGMIEDPAAVPTLTALLHDEVVEIRKQAVWALGMIEDAAAVDALIDVLALDSDPEVRAQAAWALGMIENEAAADALIAALEDESAEVRRMAMEALGRVMH